MADDRDEREDDRRSELTALFEAFDEGKLTQENAHSFELESKPTAKTERDGGASGADQGGQAAQHTGDAAKPPAAGGEQQPASRDRTRDDLGRFAKGEGQAPGQKPAGADTSPKQPQQATQPQTDQQQQAATDQAQPAPQGISPRAQQLWGTATPEQRQYIAETEGALARLAEPMRGVFEAAKEINVPWPDFIKNVTAYERSLRTNPLETMIQIADHMKIDLDELADLAAARRGNPQQQQQPNDFNRVLQPYEQRIAQLETKLTSREQADQQAQQQQRQAQVNAIKAEMETFKNSGQAPLWGDVQSELMAHMRVAAAAKPNATTTELIKDAYDRAVWANPATRAKVQAEQQRAQRSRQIQDVTDHRGSQPRTPLNGSENLSLRDELAKNWDAVHAR